jgi:hypothetical protein
MTEMIPSLSTVNFVSFYLQGSWNPYLSKLKSCEWTHCTNAPMPGEVSKLTNITLEDGSEFTNDTEVGINIKVSWLSTFYAIFSWSHCTIGQSQSLHACWIVFEVDALFKLYKFVYDGVMSWKYWRCDTRDTFKAGCDSATIHSMLPDGHTMYVLSWSALTARFVY